MLHLHNPNPPITHQLDDVRDVIEGLNEVMEKVTTHYRQQTKAALAQLAVVRTQLAKLDRKGSSHEPPVDEQPTR